MRTANDMDSNNETTMRSTATIVRRAVWLSLHRSHPRVSATQSRDGAFKRCFRTDNSGGAVVYESDKPRDSRIVVDADSIGSQDQFLHVGPSGDCWTGSSIFAAKHLQPDYVKSIALPDDLPTEKLLEELEEDMQLTQWVYDNGELPVDLITRLRQR